MKYDIDKLFQKAGENGKYQYTILPIAFGFWITMDLLSISIPFLEKTSTLEIPDPQRNSSIITQLNYDYCENLPNYEKYIIEQSHHSWVIEFGIECDKINTGLLGSYIFIGVLFGSIMFQYLPDFIGRRKTIILGGFIFSSVLFVFNFAESFEHVIVLAIILQMIAYTAMLSVFLLATEIVSPDKRSIYGAIINSAFSFAGVIFIFMYKYIEYWRLIFSYGGLINLLVTVLFVKYAIESPRYYIAKGNIKRMIECLRNIADYNGNHKEFEEEVTIINHSSFNETKHEESKFNHLNDEEICLKTREDLRIYAKHENSMLSFFKYSSLRYTFLGNCYLWFSTSGIYYGLSIYLKHLPGDIYFNGIFFYSIELFSYILSGWIINIKQLGRIGSLIIFELISLIGYFCLIFFELDDNSKIILSLFARFAISAVYNIIYTYSAEVYPTVVRAKGLGFNSICARVGGIFFPFILEILHSDVFYFFTIVNLIALIVVIFLPETLGKPLEDHIKLK